jgi:hypothetical protein
MLPTRVSDERLLNTLLIMQILGWVFATLSIVIVAVDLIERVQAAVVLVLGGVGFVAVGLSLSWICHKARRAVLERIKRSEEKSIPPSPR